MEYNQTRQESSLSQAILHISSFRARIYARIFWSKHIEDSKKSQLMAENDRRMNNEFDQARERFKKR